MQPDTQTKSVNATVDQHGVTCPAQLASLYHVHPLLPFDPRGFESLSTVSFQDQWFQVQETITACIGTTEQLGQHALSKIRARYSSS